MPSFGVALSNEQNEHLLALFEAWRAGETVAALFNVNVLINAAVFSLEDGDSQSAALQIERALKVIPAGSTNKDKLLEAQIELAAGNNEAVLVSLTELQEELSFGDPANGATLYAANCAACHGAEGEGGVGTLLQPNEFVQVNANAELVTFIQEGRSGTAMSGFATRLGEQEIADIVAHLRTWQP
jgi:mono/diheme cytochrome c family protein